MRISGCCQGESRYLENANPFIRRWLIDLQDYLTLRSLKGSGLLNSESLTVSFVPTHYVYLETLSIY